MTINQQVNHGDIQKVCHFHNDIFHSTHLCHTLPTLLSHLPCVIKNTEVWNEKMKIFCIYGCFIVSSYIKGGRKSHETALNTTASLDTHVCVNNPY